MNNLNESHPSRRSLLGLTLGMGSLYAAEPIVSRTRQEFSDEEERRLGEAVASRLEDQLKLDENPLLLRYLNALASRLVARSQRPRFAMNVKVVDDKIANAMNIPGGTIYVFKGLLQFCRTEAELVGVISHEVGHAVARHSVKKLMRLAPAYSALELGRRLAGPLANPVTDALVGTLANEFLGLIELPQSREDEVEADLLGLYQMSRAGWQPQAINRFLSRLIDEHGEENILAKFFSDHPPTRTRISYLEREIPSLPRPIGRQDDSVTFRTMQYLLKVTE